MYTVIMNYKETTIDDIEEQGALLRRLRRRRGWTQTELATIAGTNQRVISELECYLRIPDAALAQRLRIVFHWPSTEGEATLS